MNTPSIATGNAKLRAFRRIDGFAVLLLLVTGCGSDNGFATVTGVITLNGVALQNANVEFQPVSDQGSPSAGKTDDQGQYELMYSFDQPGVIPGDHVVKITTVETYFDERGEELEREERVPEKYNVRTELQRTVKPGENRMDFTL